jgi:hypothetical protein
MFYKFLFLLDIISLLEIILSLLLLLLFAFAF